MIATAFLKSFGTATIATVETHERAGDPVGPSGGVAVFDHERKGPVQGIRREGAGVRGRGRLSACKGLRAEQGLGGPRRRGADKPGEQEQGPEELGEGLEAAGPGGHALRQPPSNDADCPVHASPPWCQGPFPGPSAITANHPSRHPCRPGRRRPAVVKGSPLPVALPPRGRRHRWRPCERTLRATARVQEAGFARAATASVTAARNQAVLDRLPSARGDRPEAGSPSRPESGQMPPTY